MKRKPFLKPPSPSALVMSGEMIVLEPTWSASPGAPYVELLPGREHPPGAPLPPAPPPLKPPAGGDAAPPG